MSGTLNVTIGPMFAGKSTTATRDVQRHRLGGRRCLVIKHDSDDARLPSSKEQQHERKVISTPTTTTEVPFKETALFLNSTSFDEDNSLKAVSVSTLQQVPIESVQENDYIFVDEAQWFFDLVDIVLYWVHTLGKQVSVYGLDSDYLQHPFLNMAHLMIYAQHVKHLRAVCMVCGQDGASLSVRKSNVTSNNPILLAGGSDIYQAQCTQCFSADTVQKRRLEHQRKNAGVVEVYKKGSRVSMVAATVSCKGISVKKK